VQLVHAVSDTHLWVESYTRDLKDVLLMQREIAENVARKVHSEALPHRAPSRAITPAAHDAYLRGRYNWFAANFQTARESFEKAIQLQPNYAAAYSGIADYFIGGSVMGLLDPRVALPKGEEAAQKALQLDDASEEAHNSMAAAYLFYRWNWKAAEQESRRAIELNPNFAEAHHFHAMVLAAQNRGDEAIEAQRRAQALDPFARPAALGMILSDVGRDAEAEIEYRQRIEALPTNHILRFKLAECLLSQGREKESMEEFAEGLRLRGSEKQAKDVRAAFTRAANRGVQEWRLADLERLAAESYVSPLNFAHAYARMGQDEEAFRWLEKGYGDHVPTLIFLQQDPDLKRLHGDPRFQSLVKRIGLPEAY
jgi:tetratricopeptide (TPR) repeat protein